MKSQPTNKGNSFFLFLVLLWRPDFMVFICTDHELKIINHNFNGVDKPPPIVLRFSISSNK